MFSAIPAAAFAASASSVESPDAEREDLVPAHRDRVRAEAGLALEERQHPVPGACNEVDVTDDRRVPLSRRCGETTDHAWVGGEPSAEWGLTEARPNSQFGRASDV